MKICISISNRDLKKIGEIVKIHDFCEIRLDLIKPELNQVKEIFSLSNNLIATCRQNKDIDCFLFLKEAILNGAGFVDIEFERDIDYKNSLISYAKKNNVKRIHSYHNFKKTPELKNLKEMILKEIDNFSPDIIKIATQVNSKRDISTLFSLLDEDFKSIVVGMGEKGKIVRIISPFLGGEFTFASWKDERTASGQISYFDLKELFNNIEKALE